MSYFKTIFAVFALVVASSSAKAITLTPDALVGPDENVTISLNALSIPNLVAYDVILSVGAGLEFVSAVNDTADVGTPGFQEATGLGMLSGFVYLTGVSSTVTLSIDPPASVPGPTTFGFRVLNGSASELGFGTIDLNFKTKATATVADAFVSYQVWQFEAGQSSLDTNKFGSDTVSVLKAPNVIPLPAGAPLLLTGFAAFALMRRRTRKAA